MSKIFRLSLPGLQFNSFNRSIFFTFSSKGKRRWRVMEWGCKAAVNKVVSPPPWLPLPRPAGKHILFGGNYRWNHLDLQGYLCCSEHRWHGHQLEWLTMSLLLTSPLVNKLSRHMKCLYVCVYRCLHACVWERECVYVCVRIHCTCVCLRVCLCVYIMHVLFKDHIPGGTPGLLCLFHLSAEIPTNTPPILATPQHPSPCFFTSNTSCQTHRLEKSLPGIPAAFLILSPDFTVGQMSRAP